MRHAPRTVARRRDRRREACRGTRPSHWRPRDARRGGAPGHDAHIAEGSPGGRRIGSLDPTLASARKGNTRDAASRLPVDHGPGGHHGHPLDRGRRSRPLRMPGQAVNVSNVSARTRSGHRSLLDQGADAGRAADAQGRPTGAAPPWLSRTPGSATTPAGREPRCPAAVVAAATTATRSAPTTTIRIRSRAGPSRSSSRRCSRTGPLASCSCARTASTTSAPDRRSSRHPDRWCSPPATACIDGDGHASTHVVFVPAYRNGVAPVRHVRGHAHLGVRGWKNGGNDAFDMGAFSVGRNSKGKTLQSQVGALGFAWDQSRLQHWDLVGYPADYPFSGERPVICEASHAFDDAPGRQRGQPGDQGLRPHRRRLRHDRRLLRRAMDHESGTRQLPQRAWCRTATTSSHGRSMARTSARRANWLRCRAATGNPTATTC